MPYPGAQGAGLVLGITPLVSAFTMIVAAGGVMGTYVVTEDRHWKHVKELNHFEHGVDRGCRRIFNRSLRAQGQPEINKAEWKHINQDVPPEIIERLRVLAVRRIEPRFAIKLPSIRVRTFKADVDEPELRERKRGDTLDVIVAMPRKASV